MSLISFFLLDSEPHINIGAATTYDVEIHFIEFSTGNPHPHAREHRIFVMSTEWKKPSVGIEIVGENLVLILSHTNAWKPDNRIFIYEWKTGVLKVVRVPLTFFLVLVSTEINRASKHPTKAIQALYSSRNPLYSSLTLAPTALISSASPRKPPYSLFDPSLL